MAAGGSYSLAQLVIKFTSDIADLVTGVDKVGRQIDKLAMDVEGALGGIKSQFLGVAAIFGVGFSVRAFTDMVAGAITAESELNKLGERAGVTGSQLSSLMPVAAKTETSLDSVAGMMMRLNRAMAQSADGTGRTATSFKALGISSDQLKDMLNNPLQALLLVAQRLDQLPTGARKTSLEMQLLGRGAGTTAKFLRELGVETELVATRSQTSIDSAERLTDSYSALKFSVSSISTAFANVLVPTMQQVVTALQGVVGKSSDAKNALNELLTEDEIRAGARAVALALGYIAETILLIIRVVRLAYIETKVWFDAMILGAQLSAAAMTGDIGAMESLAAKARALDADRKAANAEWIKFWNQRGSALTDAMKKEFEYEDKAAKIVKETNKLYEGQSDQVERSAGKMTRAQKAALDMAGDAEANAKKQADTMLKLADAQTAYQKALAATAEAGVKAKAAIESDTIKRVMEENERAYHLGLISYAKYWKDRITLAEKEGKNERAVIEEQLKTQMELQKTLDEQIEGLTPAQFLTKGGAPDTGAYDIALLRKKSEREAVVAKIIELQGKLAQSDQKVIDSASAELEAWLKETAAINESVPALNAKIAAMNQENLTYGQTTAAANRSLLVYYQEQLALETANANRPEYIKWLVAEISARTKLDQAAKFNMATWAAENPILAETTEQLRLKIQQVQFDTRAMGLQASEIELLKAVMLEEQIARLLTIKGTEEEIKKRDEAIKKMREQILGHQALSAELSKVEGQQRVIEAWREVDREAETVFTNILNNGKDTWEQLTEWLKQTLIRTLYELTLRRWIISIVASIGGVSEAALAGNVGGSWLTNLITGGGGGGGGGGLGLLNSIGNIPGWMASGGMFSGGLGYSFATSGVGQMLGLSAPYAAGFIGPNAIGLTGLGTFLGTAIPIIGGALAIASLLGAFDKEPSQVQGRFGIRSESAPTSEFEDSAYVLSKYFGKIGFLDQGTKYFSGEAAKVFDQGIADALDAVGARLDETQREHLAGRLQAMEFPGFEGEYTTEDFIAKYGGQVLSQALGAAFDELDPVLGALVTGFKGTAEETIAYANSLLTFVDMTKDLPEEVRKNLEAGLDETKEGVEKITRIAVATGAIFALADLDLGQEAMDYYNESMGTQYEALTRQGDALTELIGKTDNSAEAAEKLAQATNDYASAAIAALANIQKLKADLSSMFLSTIERIKLSTMTDQQKYDYYREQAAKLTQELAATTDPEKIAELATNINDLYGKAWDLLSPEQQAMFQQDFLGRLDALNALVQQQLDDAAGGIEATAQGKLDSAADKMTQVAAKMGEAADTQDTAADNQLLAADKVHRLIVEVNLNGQPSSSIGLFA